MAEFRVFKFDADQLPEEEGVFWFFQDEWDQKQSICEAFKASKDSANPRRLGARSCEVVEVDAFDGRSFLEANHLQGFAKRSLIRYGLRHGEELLGLISLSPHHRQNHDSVVVLDRVAFKSGVTVSGGLSKLVAVATAWAKSQGYDMILTFSDNRLTDGKVYGRVGFTPDGRLRKDYFYVDAAGNRYSKQSQKKSASKCPEGLTEFQWAVQRGLRRIYDLGKKRWVLKVNPNAFTKKERQALICAKQHSCGLFKKNNIRGTAPWRNKDIYFASSYELRFLFELATKSEVLDVRRGDCIVVNGRARNPDFVVAYADYEEIVEVKPFARTEEAEEQINDSVEYAAQKGYTFRLWTERDSDLRTEKAIISWARTHLAESGNFQPLLDKRAKNRAKAKRHYDAKLSDRMTVNCLYCKASHEIRRKRYEENVAKNGRYICIVENGALIGKRPKKFLKNPLADKGLKKCTGECGRVLPLEDFAFNNKKTQARRGKCKTCYRFLANKRYAERKADSSSS
jgi:hypothetical protein